MEINELLDKLEIDYSDMNAQNGKFTILFNSSDDYQDAYVKLSKSDLVDLDDEGVIVTEHSNIMKYMADDYDLTLECDFDKDIYKLVIEEA